MFEAYTAYDIGCLLPLLKSTPDIDAIMLPSDGHVWSMSAACRMLGREPNQAAATALDLHNKGIRNSFDLRNERLYVIAGSVKCEVSVNSAVTSVRSGSTSPRASARRRSCGGRRDTISVHLAMSRA